MDPTVLTGDVSVSPAAVSAIASSVDPFVIQSSLSLSPGFVSAIASSSGPSAVILGSLSISPAALSAIAISIDPTVLIPGEPTYTMPHFRFRSGDTVGLNVDSDWEAAIDANVTLDAGLVFRVRFEVEETAGNGSATTYKLQYKLNAGSWTDVSTQSSSSATTPVLALLSNQYTNLDATTNLLSGSSKAFDAGVGLEDSAESSSLNIDNEHTEIEFCLMMIGFSDGYIQLADSDSIELRIIEGDDTVFSGSYNSPTITVAVPDYYVGGCWVESPVHVGPLRDDDGNLYHIMECTSEYNTPIMVKSSDGGKSWAEVDGSNRPSTTDAESGEAVLVGDEIHFVMHKGSSVTYHKFRVSTHSTNPIPGRSQTRLLSVAFPRLTRLPVWLFSRLVIYGASTGAQIAATNH